MSESAGRETREMRVLVILLLLYAEATVLG